MSDQHQAQPFNRPRIVGPNGEDVTSKPKAPETCPGCGAGKGHRTTSAGFGTPHLVCTSCGHEFNGATE